MIDLVCIASGPSLTIEDCDTVFKSGIDTMTVNTSYMMAPWCKYLFAGDLKWWEKFHSLVPATIEKWTSYQRASKLYAINLYRVNGPFNSGMRALMLAIDKGFKSIALLGYDCSIVNGTHWHGDHENGLNNPDKKKVDSWHEQFYKVYKKATSKNVDIINCSRHTELTVFPVSTLEEVLRVH